MKDKYSLFLMEVSWFWTGAVCESIKPLFLLPGLSDGISKEYRPVVFNQRSTGGFPLKTLDYTQRQTLKIWNVLLNQLTLYIQGAPIFSYWCITRRYICRWVC